MAVLGEALIDFVADDDGSYRAHLGGSPYNVAIGLARQGVEVSYLSPLSDDAFGDRLQESLRGAGVRLPRARRSKLPTSLALVAVDAYGTASYRIYRDGIADLDTTAEEIERSLPSGLALFHTGSLAITPNQLPLIRRLFAELRRREVVISLDLNIRLGATSEPDEYLAGVREILREADIVKASDEDLQALRLHDDPQEAARIVFREMGSGLLVFTRGAGGACLLGQHGLIARPAYATRLADTIGAGDCFQAAFLAELERAGLFGRAGGLDFEPERLAAALDFACAAAAISIARAGCSPPNFDEVWRFMAAAAPRTPG